MRRCLVLCVVMLVLAGCAAYMEESADREVAPLLEEMQEHLEGEQTGETPEGVITPKPEGAQAHISGTGQALGEPRIIDLKESLALAFSNSREFKMQKESLYLAALSFTATRHNYHWRPSGTVSGDIATSGNGSAETVNTAGGNATLSLARKLLSGGQFSLSTSASQSGTVGGPGTDSNSSSVSASFSAPLLAGAGIAARETMVQARRSLLQSARSFESFRQEMVIGIITQYYGLLRQKRAIETAKQRVRQAEFLYGQSNALFKKGRKSFAEVLVAEQSKLNSDNDLVNIVEEYDLALDRFKQDLGLRADLHMDIAEEEIEPEIIIVDLAMATKTAFENRLDYITQREHIEDAERAVEIARNALLPQLSLALQAGVSSDADGMLTDYRLDDGSSSLGLTLELPLDRKSQRNSYKSTLISLARARRSFSLFEDNMRLSVRDTVRKLQRAEVTLAIQKKQVKTAMDRLEVEKIYQEKGQRSSQDIVNAQNALQNARNALVEAQINYLIATIRLRKDIGTLRVNERGEWH